MTKREKQFFEVMVALYYSNVVGRGLYRDVVSDLVENEDWSRYLDRVEEKYGAVRNEYLDDDYWIVLEAKRIIDETHLINERVKHPRRYFYKKAEIESGSRPPRDRLEAGELFLVRKDGKPFLFFLLDCAESIMQRLISLPKRKR